MGSVPVPRETGGDLSSEYRIHPQSDRARPELLSRGRVPFRRPIDIIVMFITIEGQDMIREATAMKVRQHLGDLLNEV